MDQKKAIRISKYLSRHLRHQPDRLGITLDPAGWVPIEELLAACRRHRMPITPDELRHIVATNNKQRFAFSEDGLRIRANQGHTVPVDLGLPPVQPPPLLYHGTVSRFLPQIQREGLRPMSRHDVHLSPTPETARQVGSRRGAPLVLTIDAAAMSAAGHLFRVTPNSVWLTPVVPPSYLSFRLPNSLTP